MRAGTLSYTLTLLRPEITDSAYGSPRTEYKAVGTIHAERAKMTATNSMEVGEVFPDYRVDWLVRIEHKIKEHWRVQEQGGHLYNITNIIPNRRRGLQTLVCERVNE